MFAWFKRKAPPPEREVVRLTADEFRKLKEQLPNSLAPTDSYEYAYRLGVQHALQVIQEGFTIDS